MSQHDVVGVGMATVDVLTVVPRLPKPDEVYRVVRTDLQGGGPVATALVALARLGAEVTYLGVVAPDDWGQFMLADFRRYGVDTGLIVRAEAGASPLSAILIEQATGSRAILCDPGRLPELPLSDAWRAAIRNARALHLDGWYLPLALEAARAARDAGVLVSFDGSAGEPRPGVEALLELADVSVVARKFARNVTGLDDPLLAGPALRRFGAREVVITDGAAGCWLWEGGRVHAPARVRGVRSGYHWRGGHLPRRVSLRAAPRLALAAPPRIRQRHGCAQMHATRRSARHPVVGRGNGFSGTRTARTRWLNPNAGASVNSEAPCTRLRAGAKYRLSRRQASARS
jgi:sugar/nucleoside kinase (ribokinase family)